MTSTTSYTYGTNFSVKAGVPTVVTDTNGNQTLTTYDAMGRVTQNTFANDGALQYTYSNSNQLSAVTRGDGQTVSFDYDAFGNSTEISIGSLALASYTYGANNGMLLSQTYGNGDSVSFTYDILGRNKTTTYSDGRVLTYGYTGDGQLYSIDDSKTGYRYEYTYDFNGRVIASSVSQGQTILLQTRQTYNANSQLTKQTWQMGSQHYSEIYTYNKTTGSVATVTTGNGDQLTLTYDALQRPVKVDTPILDRNYTYRDISDSKTTSQISSLWYGDTQSAAPFSYSYTYDALGNIASYTDSNGTVSYTYDDMGQLLVATGAGQNYTYTYDDYGNILTASNGTDSHIYGYSSNSMWKDLLYTFDGQSITYDGCGNPTSYYNGNSYTFEWAEGRRLVSAVTGDSTISYVYDMNGLRTSKVTADAASTYYYAGGKLFREVRGTDTLDFFYDQSGTPYALKYNGTIYYYILNLQGDVMAMVDADGTVVASYTYSPYGEVLTATGTMAEINPLRYRGYYYDTETCLYYLQSRYYDPVLGRFLNADSYASTGQSLLGYNMYAYCGNNPIGRTDMTGETWWDWEEKLAFGTMLLVVGVAILLSVPTGGGSVAVGSFVIAELSAAAAVNVTAAGAALTVVGTAIVTETAAEATINYAKQSKRSGKERATDKPSWVSQSDIDMRKTAQENARILLDEKYGSGNWGKGPGTEFNRIVKWIQRCLRLYGILYILEEDYE